MAQTDYPNLLWDRITEVRDWSNRDSEVLSDAIIFRCLQYAADSAYRDVKTPMLERTARWTITDSDLITNELVVNRLNNITEGRYVILRVPVDAVDFMHLRVEDTGVVFNEKLDDRTFYDAYATKTSFNRWARVGQELHVAGEFNVGQTIALHYRRRLGGLDARYAVNSYNFDTEILSDGNRTYLKNHDDNGALMTSNETSYIVDGQSVFPIAYNRTVDGITTTDYFVGRVQPNWFRDDNKKVLVFGALYHAFSYLGDPEMMQIWGQKAAAAVEELNREEAMRRASGGNVSINYTSHLI